MAAEHAAVDVEISPDYAASGRSFSTTLAYEPFGTKQMSLLSGLSATGRSKRAARRRVSTLSSPPSGKRRNASCSGVVAKENSSDRAGIRRAMQSMRLPPVTRRT